MIKILNRGGGLRLIQRNKRNQVREKMNMITPPKKVLNVLSLPINRKNARNKRNKLEKKYWDKEREGEKSISWEKWAKRWGRKKGEEGKKNQNQKKKKRLLGRKWRWFKLRSWRGDKRKRLKEK